MALFSEADLEFTPEEMEFFGEDEVITVIPTINLATTDSSLICIGGEWGPFRPNFPVEVPLWLALALQKKKCCRIQIPAWMHVQNLEDVLAEEQAHEAIFQPLPFHYIEVAHLLLRHAKEAFEEGNDVLYQTANLVKDIRMERFEKIDKGLQALEGPITVKLNNVSAMECNTIRHFFQGALNRFYKLAQMEEPVDMGLLGTASSQQTQQENRPPPRQLRRTQR
ncbi:hypothetical protein WJX77_008571 [Trebouxia sp. C0004]